MAKSILNWCLAFLCLLLIFESASSQAGQVYFERLSVEHGLSQSTVNAILQDHRGYMWFGTLNGLNRYDGYTFTVYRHIPDDITSISNDQIFTIYEDQLKRLWIATADGLNRFDPKTQTFKRFYHDPSNAATLSNSFVNDLYHDSAGVLWLATQNGLDRLNPETDTFTRIGFRPNALMSLSHPVVTALCEDPEGNLWIGTRGGGINILNRKRNQIEHIYALNYPIGAGYTSAVYDFLLSMQHRKKPLIALEKIGDSREIKSNFNLNQTTEFVLFASGEQADSLRDYAWLEKDGKTIWQMNPEKARYAGGAIKNRIQIVTLKLTPGNYSLCYRSDDSHSFEKWNRLPPNLPELWGAQIYKISSGEKVWLEDHLQEIKPPYKLSSNNISDIFLDENESVWIATLGGGLNKVHLNSYSDSSKVAHEPTSPNPVFASYSYLSGSDRPAFRQNEQDKKEMVFHEYRTYPDSFVTTYDKRLLENIRRLKTRENTIAEILKAGNNLKLEQNFLLTEKTQVLIISMGEVSGRQPNDFGFLSEDGKIIWQQTFKNSRYAGGGVKNRISVALKTLKPGSYSTGYRSDHNHSYKNWNRRPPENSDLWGIQILAINKPKAKTIERLLQNESSITQIAHGTTRNLIQGRDGIFWIATANGLSRLDADLESFKNYRNISKDFQSLSSNDVQSVYEDRTGIIWIGTVLGGINKVNTTKNSFQKFGRNPFSKNSLHNQVVYSFLQDKAGLLWVGTRGGLNIFDRRNKLFLRPSWLNSGLGEIRNSVMSIMKDRRNLLWIGTDGGGLYRFSFDRIQKYIENPEAILQLEKSEHPEFKNYLRGNGSNQISYNSIWHVFEDSKGVVWVGTRGGGLNSIEFTQNHEVIRRYSHNPQNENTLSSNRVRVIFEDRAGTLWLGTHGGLNRFNRKTGKFHAYKNDIKNRTSLSHNMVTSIYEDEEDMLWVATYGGGLNRFNPKTERFTRFSEKDGLPNNVVYSVMPDNRRNLWMTTNHGISCFNLDSKIFKNYDMENNLQSNEFNTGAYHKTPGGEMIFGGINGFNIFNPDSIRENKHIPSIVITNFKKNGKSITPEQDIFQLEEITISPDDKFIAFEFAALDYTNPAKNQYAYKLAGLSDDWILCGNQRFASFANLAPGDYIFKVKGSNNDGLWNEAGVSVKLKVLPPFWRTQWFMVSIFSFCVLAFVVLHKSRVRAKVKQSLVLERVRIQERERMRSQVSKDYHDELGHKLTKISLFSELLRRNINGGQPDMTRYLGKIIDSADSLGKDTRDFIWTLNPEKDTLFDLTVYLNEFGKTLFEDTSINFSATEIQPEFEKICLSMGLKREITLIFKEAMHNALKYSDCNTAVLQVIVEMEFLNIKFSDDGAGFDMDLIQNNGNRNGLLNMNARSEKAGGELEIKSAIKKGTSVCFKINYPELGILNEHPKG